MPHTTMTRSRPAVRGIRDGGLIRALVVLGVAMVLGALTAGGQQWLPDQLRSLANSSGSWALVAFLLAMGAWRARWAALCGAVSLAGLLAGYVLFNGIRGYAASVGLVVFWGAAAAVVGPLLGLGGHWLATRRDAVAGVGAGGMAGILIGEGVYGLTAIADTTYPPYWWASVAAGVFLLVVAVVVRLRRVGPAVVATGTCAIVAAAFVTLYAADLLAAL